jgi:hypothetical protein
MVLLTAQFRPGAPWRYLFDASLSSARWLHRRVQVCESVAQLDIRSVLSSTRSLEFLLATALLGSVSVAVLRTRLTSNKWWLGCVSATKAVQCQSTLRRLA